MAVPVVCIPYEKLLDPNADLTQEIIKGFGLEGLGIVTVSGVPDYPQLRQQLLPLAQAFADLPDDVKAAHEHAPSRYNVGWSHGKEALRSGLLDTHKGSYYGNPLQDTYTVDQDTAERYKAYYSPNIWPQEHLPQLESAFKQLGSLIIDVGLKLAGHCSKYVQQQIVNATGEPLSAADKCELDFAGQLSGSSTHKARLLHYFPVQQQQQQHQDEDWCGWHLDHGSLTGLTCAMYIQDGKPVPTPDPQAGLYICNRAGQVVQASIPPDHIAFQLGQVLSIQSGGLLRATPHYVRAAAPDPAKTPGAARISRNTFAVFMQPELDVQMVSPKGLEALGGLLCMDSGHWSPGMSFGDFAEHTLDGYYTSSPQTGSEDAPRQSEDDTRHVPGTPDYPPAPNKDVAPAAVHLAAAAAGRQFAQLMITHD